MSVARLTRIPNAWPAQAISGASGTLVIANGVSYLGTLPAGLLQGCEKYSFIIKVSAISATNTLKLYFDGSIDGVNFSNTGEMGSILTIAAIGTYGLIYNGSPWSVVKATFAMTGVTPTATVAIDCEANPM